jgi:hypothetical protein
MNMAAAIYIIFVSREGTAHSSLSFKSHNYFLIITLYNRYHCYPLPPIYVHFSTFSFASLLCETLFCHKAASVHMLCMRILRAFIGMRVRVSRSC